jgi:group II intron reverse transcriptase/maturase
VNEAARRDKRTRFTALLHHVNVEALERSFRRLKRGASAGVDGETVASYERDLSRNLEQLCERIHTGGYRPQPVRRAYIPKSDGGQRPIGVPTLEDKVVQGAVAEVLSAIYEVDFLGFSYGFRPGRSPHQALVALSGALMTQRVNWVLDADIRSFFDSVDHEWMMRMVSHRIADRRVLRLISRWLKAGVMESYEWEETVKGTPQGAGISPLLSNIFLHYVLDLWVHHWRRRQAWGYVIIVRFADDWVTGFQYEGDARRFLAELRERLKKFHLMLHESKTRLIEFGRWPTKLRAQRGERRPRTFSFLGFTHYCAICWDGRFMVKRKTNCKRRAQKLKRLRIEARKRMHSPVTEQYQWLCRVLRGHYNYYGLPGNFQSLSNYFYRVCRIWYRSLKRRSRVGMNWKRFEGLLKSFPLPQPRITHTVESLRALLG